jgi:dihydropteroate synthase
MHEWQLGDRTLTIDRRPLVMGIVNVTPDSFSDGGSFLDPASALAHGQELVEHGADLVDVGGESTRPGAEPVSFSEELARVLPVVEGLAGRIAVPISVDTSKAEVARRCLQAGAEVINDVTALGGDAEMLEVVRAFGAGVVLMHMQGTPRTMQKGPQYEDVIAEVLAFLEERIAAVTSAGILRKRIALDPGIGFGKTGQHNLEILARLGEFQRLGRPVCLGVSRKAFIGKILERPLPERLAGSLAAILFAQARGAVQIVRVHDVRETRDAVNLFSAIEERQVHKGERCT